MHAMMNGPPHQIPAEAKARLRRLDALAARSPESAPVHSVRSQMRMFAGDRPGALADIARYLDLAAYASPEMLLQAGQLAQQLGDKETARKHLERAAQTGLAQAKTLLEQL